MIQVFGHFATIVLGFPRTVKRVLALTADTALCVVSVWLAFYLRLDEFLLRPEVLFWPAAVSIVIAIPMFIVSGLYRAIFRYSGMPAMMAMTRAIFLYSLLYASIFTFVGMDGVPRTIGLIQPILLFLLVGASRAFIRIWLGGSYLNKVEAAALPRVLIYGAGSAGRQLAAAMTNNHEMRVVGFIDDDQNLRGNILNGLLIHNPDDLNEVISERSISQILLALPSVSRQRRNSILSFLSQHKVVVRTLPGFADIASGRVSISEIRDLDIDDLLGRESVKPNEILLNKNNTQKTILVTGAGGSIGSELCRQILSTRPKRILLFEISEFALYQIHHELLGLSRVLKGACDESCSNEDSSGENFHIIPEIEIIPLLGSVCNEMRMHEIMSTWKPHIVYHAAAYKHVPLVEHNPTEGIRNNVWGTRVCAEVAVRNGVKHFVLVSTDKAVRPTNIMGASKRLAELVLQAFAVQTSSGSKGLTTQLNKETCFSMVRFGNVLGSSGSVVPLFREQIKMGGPITLTHIDITRYFMTIPEAAQLVIQAGAMGTGGDVFVLDMGEPVRIYDLARRIVELSGLSIKNESNPNGDIDISVTGMRPGEKLYEELLIGDNPKPTQHSRIMKAHEDFIEWNKLEKELEKLNKAMIDNNIFEVRDLLRKVVIGYRPDGDIVDWVSLAQKSTLKDKN